MKCDGDILCFFLVLLKPFKSTLILGTYVLAIGVKACRWCFSTP